jgi:hypothetical protein
MNNMRKGKRIKRTMEGLKNEGRRGGMRKGQKLKGLPWKWP